MSKFVVSVEYFDIVEVDAINEDDALNKVKEHLYQQNPKNTARVSIVKETRLLEDGSYGM